MIKEDNNMEDKFDPRCHIGEIHGIYMIVDMLDKKDKYGHWIYKSVCVECGHELFSHYGRVSGEKSKTITCNHIGASGYQISNEQIWDDKRIAKIFNNMVARCYNSNDKAYKWYGAKGIGICAEWLRNPASFEAWALQNGYVNTLTIDRIDADKDYSPGNCRWIPLSENTRRAGKVNWIAVGDDILTGHQWAAKLGIGTNTINMVIRQHGEEKAKELIVAMLKDPPSTKKRKSHQTWFSAYGIQV